MRHTWFFRLITLLIVVFNSSAAMAQLQLTARVSKKSIFAGEPLLLHVAFRNSSEETVSILPVQKFYRSRLFASFEQVGPGIMDRKVFRIGSQPRLAGINAVIQVVLQPGMTHEATIDCLTPQFHIYGVRLKGDADPIFIYPGTYQFQIVYHVDDEASNIFNLPKIKIESEFLEVEVLPDPNGQIPTIERKPYWTDEEGNFIPHRFDLDGIMRPMPPKENKISREERREIQDIYNRVVLQNQAKYEDDPSFDYMLGFPYHIVAPCRLTFFPMVWHDSHHRLLGDRAKMAALRWRMLEIESLLREVGIEAYACGRWSYFREKCGND